MPQPARGKDMRLLCLHSFIYFIGENLVLGFLLLCPLALVLFFPLLWYTVSSRIKIPKFGQSHALIRAPSIHQLLAVTETGVFRWSCVRETVAMLCPSRCFFPRAAFVCFSWPDSWFLMLGLCVLVFDCHIDNDSLWAVWCIGFQSLGLAYVLLARILHWEFGGLFLGSSFWGRLVVKLPFERKSSKYSLCLHLSYLVLLSISFPLSKDLELFPFYFQVQTSMINCVPEF